MPSTLRLYGIAAESIVDGPGFRYAIFVQGCPHHCPGCHNPDSHDFSAGYDRTVDSLFEEICADPLLKGVTFSGGEPFCQPAPLTELARLCRQRGLDVLAYSGWTYEQLLDKHDPDVDALLEVLAKEQPNIPRLSAAGEAEIARQKAEKAARRLPQLSKEAEQSVGQLKRASDYLARKPELAKELSAAERRKRAQLQSKPVYKYVALIISLFGVVSAAYGIQSIINHTGNYGIYFALFGFAAIFLFSSYNMMPTAHNNHNAIMKRADRAEAAMADYIKADPGGNFPVPDIYAHPVVLKQMTDALQEGRAVTLPEALEAVKNRLKEVNADVQVEQEEYDEIVQIKAMFLNHDYQ